MPVYKLVWRLGPVLAETPKVLSIIGILCSGQIFHVQQQIKQTWKQTKVWLSFKLNLRFETAQHFGQFSAPSDDPHPHYSVSLTHLASVGSQTALRGKSLSTDVAVKRPVLQSLDLRLVVSKVLLKVGQLDEGPTTLWYVALVRTLACKPNSQTKCNIQAILSVVKTHFTFYLFEILFTSMRRQKKTNRHFKWHSNWHWHWHCEFVKIICQK